MKVIALLQVLMIGALSFSALSLYTKDIKPHINSRGAIEMVANYPLCGGVWIKPKATFIDLDPNEKDQFASAELYLRSVLFKTNHNPKKELATVKLNPEGIRASYGSGITFRPESHYEIFCIKRYVTKSGQTVDRPVNCGDFVELDRIKHNRACVIGPAGPGGSFAPLNMK
jgi:hypothetical protein